MITKSIVALALILTLLLSLACSPSIAQTESPDANNYQVVSFQSEGLAGVRDLVEPESGSDGTFTTPFTQPVVQPEVSTLEPSNITPVSATLNGQLVDLGSFSSVRLFFEWGEDTAYGKTTEVHEIQYTASFSAELTDLVPGVVYHYRAVAVGDTAARVEGKDMTFSPVLTPLAVVTGQAEAGIVGAELIGELTGFGSSAPVELYFEWGKTKDYGNISEKITVTNTGPFSIFVPDLKEHVTYHFRAVAAGDSLVTGGDMIFTPYAVATDPASSVTSVSAVLNGNINPVLVLSDAMPVSFEWGTDKRYGNTTKAGLKESGNFSAKLSNLAPGTTYHYRAKIDIVGDIYYGLDQQFTTPGAPPQSPVERNDWYVSPKGDDVTGDGSRSHPFQSIWTAIAKAKPGNFIHILPGVYPGNLRIAPELVLRVY